MGGTTSTIGFVLKANVTVVLSSAVAAGVKSSSPFPHTSSSVGRRLPAFVPNSKVATVSSLHVLEGDTASSRVRRVLPDSDSCRVTASDIT